MGQIDEKSPQVVEGKTGDLITSVQLGIWEVLTIQRSPFDPKQWRDDILTGYSQFYRLLADMYRMDSRMFLLFIFSKAWEGVEGAILMHLSNRLLEIVRRSSD